MSRLFISHSSQDNGEAAALDAWLKEQGWDDVFLDVSPEGGIAAGERWERALNEAASRCEAVLFMVSRAWIASRWCRKEYDLARRLNKRLFGALIEAIPVAELPSEITDTFQMVDLASGQDHVMIRTRMPRTQEEVHVTFSQEGLSRLRGGLAKAGLDPRFFAWPPAGDPGRAPFRGLLALEGEDAGIFFGREAPIIEGLDTLRGLAEAAAPRLLVILGASGAGKSSFLRAGLLPRLARDDRTFLTLPVLRPGGGTLTGESGLLPALEAALAARGAPRSRAVLRIAIAGGAATLKPLLAELVSRSFGTMAAAAENGAKPPTVVLTVDQAEELFVPGNEGEDCLDLVRDLARDDGPPVIVVFAIRSDAYDRLETAKPLEGLRQRSLPLLPMPRGAYQTVIEGPAARLAGTRRPLAIEPRLTQRLLEDIDRGGGSDALPLLAFTLGQLYLDFGGGGRLRLADYEEFGGIRGAIEAAVRRAMLAADRDPRIPRDPEARLLLLRRGLIPWLAGVDPDTSSPRRRLARLADIPEEAEPLIRLLVEQRLLSVDRTESREGGGEAGAITIEPAHEALLRQWGTLRGWLQEDFAALAILDAVKRAARDWEANGAGPDWLNHTGTRLAEAESVALRPDLSADLSANARDYLARCRARDDAKEAARGERIANERRLAESRVELAETGRLAAEERTRAGRRFTRLAVGATLGLALFLLACGALYGLYELQRRQAADARLAAEAGRWLAKSQAELRDDHPVEATRSALAAYRVLPREDTRSALLTALLQIPALVGSARLGETAAQAVTWLDRDTVGIASRAGLLRAVGARPGGPAPPPVVPGPPDIGQGFAQVRALRTVSPGGPTLAVLSDGSVLRLAAGSREPATLLAGGAGVVDAAAIGRDGRTVAIAASGEGLRLLRCGDGRCEGRTVAAFPVRAVALDPGEGRIAVGDEAGRVLILDREGAPQGEPVELGAPALSLAWSPDGSRLVAGTAAGEAVVIDPAAAAILARQPVSARPIRALAIPTDGRDLVAACGVASACLLRLPAPGSAPSAVLRLPGDAGNLVAAEVAPGGERVVGAFADGVLRVWSLAPKGPGGGVFRPDRGGAALLRVAVSPDGARIAAGDGAGGIQLWDRRSGQPSGRLGRELEGEVRSLAFAPDGRLAALYDDGTLAIWPAGPAGAPTTRSWEAHANAGLAWLDGGRRLAVALADGRIMLHEPATGRDEVLPAIGPGQDPWGLAALDEGRRLAATYVGGEIRVWTLADRSAATLRRSVDATPDERGAPESLSVSADGRWLAVTGEDSRVRLFEVAGPGRAALPTESASTRAVAFSPDGRRLAALGQDGRVYLWRREGADLTRELAFAPQAGDDPGAPGRRQPANWLAWLDPDTLAVATSLATIQTVALDETAWIRRAETLDLPVGSAP